MSDDGEEEIIIIGGGGGPRPKQAEGALSVYDEARAKIDAAEAEGKPIRFERE